MKKLLGNFSLKKNSETEFSIRELECVEKDSYEMADEENSDTEDLELFMIEKAQEELEEEFDQQELTRTNRRSVRSKRKKSINTLKPSQINLFKNQSIEKIRRRNKPFRDPYFQCNVNSILHPNTKNQHNIFGNLCQEFYIQNRMNYAELNSKIKWKRPQAICYDLRIGRYEFVLLNNGKSLGNTFTQTDFLKCFSSEDIFQGSLGDCFMIATFLSLCNNKEIMAKIIPMDNAYRKNMKIGAYHFRLWKIGKWYDVVIDDYLPLDMKHCPLFVKNKKYYNEFWICLIEKCVAKFVGIFEDINGGYSESIAITFSGGIHNLFHSQIIKNATNGTPITNQFSAQFARSLQEQFGSVQAISPNIDEMFIIFQYALKAKHLIGCCSTMDITTQFGLIKEHQYAITAVFVINNVKIIRIQNPHNQSDNIKRTHQYIQFENFLKSKGLSSTYYGEFYMKFNDFLNCFDQICVFNLLPEKPVVKLPQRLKNLKFKCNIFTQWRIVQMRGRMSGTQVGSQFRVDFQIKASAKEQIIICLCQEYSRISFLVVLNLYKNLQQIARYNSAGYQTQQNFHFFLDSGTYIAVFEAGSEINKSVDVCARIFYNKASKCIVNYLKQ